MADRDTSPTSTASIHSTINLHPEHAARGSSSASPPTSTPPTSLGDDNSILSEVTKMEQSIELQQEASLEVEPAAEEQVPQSADTTNSPNSGRSRPPRRTRKSVPTYNLQILAGTGIHTPTKYLKVHHGNVVHGSLEDIRPKTAPASTPKKRTARPKQSPGDISDSAERQLVAETAQAAQRRPTRGSAHNDLLRMATQNSSSLGEFLTNTVASGKNVIQRALTRSASDSQLRSTAQSAVPASSKVPRKSLQARSGNEDSWEDEESKDYFKPKSKEWLLQGLFVGQHRDFDARLSETQNRRRKSRNAKESTALPLPMFRYADTLHTDPRVVYRDFKLPFDVYHPLPRKVKADGWIKLSKNRFIGDASALWKRDKQDASQCYCEPDEGCGEACHNRIMAYECDETNCRLTEEQCGNRPFAQLKKRSKGNGYDYGVEVMETDGKGYGVRAMRSFEKHQIIVEYAGEIITQTECERRMKQIYKKDKCYYLMSFDNKMIIDATRGTIARFVNHSCEPNCEMIKWTVRGEPRMALFAGNRGIMSGEELTYDYNFDPFSTKNIQECHCGTESCRGVLGPKLKKPANEERSLASTLFAGTKRKLQEVFSSGRGSDSASSSPKKRKFGNSAQTKLMNAQAQDAAAREKAKQEAAALAAQLASRETRALKRNQPAGVSTRSVRKGTSKLIKTTRTTTFNIRKVPKPGALKPVNRRTLPAPKPNGGRKGLRPNRATTPDDDDDDSASEDESPNITPASLRSASRKQQQKLTQTKLPFKLAGKKSSSSSRDAEKLEIPDSEDESEEIGKTFRGKKRANAPAPRGLRDTGTGVFKLGRRGRAKNGVFTKGKK
ncbi:hypothetical protein CC80DRAFT_452008 [Byssothecium circinans]|uniref:SET domain-containing protein n=1 Tax=Byssothecium circinans TaxID=147558 RepID=A0A6A5TPA5_9PLEO|nr:hypothetical protein CC80DRAFT_452008 [Byssothecium circinans]